MAEGAEGKIVQVIGTVVDVEFPPDNLPSIFNAVELELHGERLVLEVEQQVGNSWVRCLALGPSEGLLPCRWAKRASADCSTSWASRWITWVPSMPRSAGRSTERLPPTRTKA